MALEIQFINKAKSQLVEQFQMRSFEGGWTLPEVVLAPIDNLPHVTRIQTSVVGKPSAVAGRLQSALFNREFQPPIPLSERRALGGGLLGDAGPLPTDAVCDLTVTVGYFDSDGKGRSTGPERVVTKICKLFSSPLPDQPPELVVENREGQIVTVDEPARLVLRVRYARGNTLPEIALLYPETVVAPDDPISGALENVLPDLRKSLNSALELTAKRYDTSGDATTYHLNFTPRLDQRTKSCLTELSESLLVPLQATLEGAEPVRALLRLETKQQQFPGWLVIDFGTTNSTVSVFDPRSIPPQEGLHPEQEEVLRERLLHWLGLPAEEAIRGGRHFANDWRRLVLQVSGTSDTSSDAGPGAIKAGPPAQLYEALARLELSLRGMRGVSPRRHLAIARLLS